MRRPEPERIITRADLDAIGGIEGGMRTHADAMVARLVSGHDPADARAVRALMVTLTLRQPDGSLSTALVPADELRPLWTGVSPLDPLVDAAAGPTFRLLRKATLALGSSEPRPFVSLGHDALAKVAEAWRPELEREELERKRRRASPGSWAGRWGRSSWRG